MGWSRDAKGKVLMPTFASFLILNDSVASGIQLVATLASFQLLNVWHPEASDQVLVPTFAFFLLLKASAQLHMEKELGAHLYPFPAS
jgi:hypothetical protein